MRICTILTILCALLLTAVPTRLAAQGKPEVVQADATGTEFLIAIPPNEILPFPVEGLEIYIASAFDANVEVFDYASDKVIRFSVKAFDVKTLSDRKELNWSMEVRDAEKPVLKALRIKSDRPIFVNVINSKTTTSDGYLAIPTHKWGTEYIAASYWDFREFKPWPGGFIIIAREPTEVKIRLRGQGKGLARTSNGRSIGDSIIVLLDEGEVYMVHGDGLTRGEFDLTGSLITSDKPIGVIGFHMRTTVPNLLINGNGRNHLSEMLPPTSAWGTKYASLELQRTRLLAGRGDAFRVVAKEDQTRWTCKFYDRVTGKLLGQRGGLLQKSGDFQDEAQTSQPTALVEGFSVWEADKPFLLMQYSCSSSFDGDQLLDPFMICIAPEDQFLKSIVFQTPTMAQFTKHYLNLVIKTDTTDPNLLDNLKSLQIDGQPVWSNPKTGKPSLLFARMPNGMYYASIELGTTARASRISSNGRLSFSGYLYGFGAVDAYGWPLGSGASSPTIDTMRPMIARRAIDGDCGSFRCTATELRNIPDPPLTMPNPNDQVETGLASIDTTVATRPQNYRLRLVTDQRFPIGQPYKRFDFDWLVIDKSKNAFVIYSVRDFAGNVTTDTLSYRVASTIDTAAPAVERLVSRPTLWDLSATEETFRPDPPRQCPSDSDQIDQGLASITCLCTNMRLIGNQLSFHRDSLVRRAEFSLAVEDSRLDGLGVVTVRDRAGNIKLDTIRYSPSTSARDPQTRREGACEGISIVSGGPFITVRWSDAPEAGSITVTNVRGQVVATRPTFAEMNVPVRIGPLESGLYVVRYNGVSTRCGQSIVISP